MSNLGDSYRDVILNDESRVRFLKERGLLSNLNVRTKLSAAGDIFNRSRFNLFKQINDGVQSIRLVSLKVL